MKFLLKNVNKFIVKYFIINLRANKVHIAQLIKYLNINVRD